MKKKSKEGQGRNIIPIESRKTFEKWRWRENGHGDLLKINGYKTQENSLLMNLCFLLMRMKSKIYNKK
jgi:hypothetical protein